MIEVPLYRYERRKPGIRVKAKVRKGPCQGTKMTSDYLPPSLGHYFLRCDSGRYSRLQGARVPHASETTPLLGPYSTHLPGALWWSSGGGAVSYEPGNPVGLAWPMSKFDELPHLGRNVPPRRGTKNNTHLNGGHNAVTDYRLLSLFKRFRRYYLTHAITRTMTGSCSLFSLAPKDAPRRYARMQ